MQVIETCGPTTIAELVRQLRHGVVGSQALTVFNHAIVCSAEVLNSRRLFNYLEWWDHKLATEIDDENLFFLFAFYFEVPSGKQQREFESKMKAARRGAQMKHTDVELLLPLGKVEVDDLLQFIDDHELFIPQARREEIAEHIIRETGGQYERAVALLELIVHDQYHRLLEEMHTDNRPDNSDGW